MKRADALDALRGIAILLMVLSGNLHGAVPLPAWMYHAQVPPPSFVFTPDLPGITWVDLVFPFFLFAMGAAVPFALSKRLDGGVPRWRIVLQILFRGVLLAWFAIYLQHIKPFVFSKAPTTGDWLMGILGFALLFPVFLRLPEKMAPALRLGIRAGGVLGSALLVSSLRFPDGSGFTVTRSDIIIIVLANVAVAGGLLWLFTRHAVLPRLGVLGVLLALRLTQGVEGSWNQWLWNSSPVPWVSTVHFLQYLFIVVPGTIAGDLMYSWMKSPDRSADAEGQPGGKRHAVIAVLMAAIVVVTVAGLFSRYLLTTVGVDALLCVAAGLVLARDRSSFGSLFRQLFHWGWYWLLLGLVFEAYEGGIKKDHPTMSYYCVTTGLALFTTVAFAVVCERFRRSHIIRLLIENGRNPMIAYVAGSTLILPLLAVTRLELLLDALSATPWLIFLRGMLITLLVSLATAFFSKKQLYWRT